MHILHRKTVLVLNKNWQAINVTTPAEALSMMFSDTAMGLEIKGEDFIIPCTWTRWLETPISDNEEVVNTPRGKIKIPKIIINLPQSRCG